MGFPSSSANTSPRSFHSSPAARRSVACRLVEDAAFKNAIGGDQRAIEFLLKNLRGDKYRNVRLVGVGGIVGDQPGAPVETSEVDEQTRSRRLLQSALADPQFVALAHAVDAALRAEETGTVVTLHGTVNHSQ
jgi:hypothetical protein